MNKLILLMSLYLLGSARGASGQPDEPLGSMAHPGSVQQLSGEYFSLANPSDVEALYETSSVKNALSGHGTSEHSSSEHTAGEHTSGEHTAGEHTSGEHTAGEHTSGEQPSGEKSSGEHASSEQLSGEQPSDEQASVDLTSGEHTSAPEPTSGEQATGEQTTSEPTSVEQATGEQTTSEHPSGEQASGEQILSEQTSSAPASSTASDTSLSCHTCAYMNDQGKCLRGEGVCSTQKSQQCMLKKIFEGGKLQFIVQGCENMCPSMNLFSHGTRMQIICCRNQSFCNKI